MSLYVIGEYSVFVLNCTLFLPGKIFSLLSTCLISNHLQTKFTDTYFLKIVNV